VNPDTDTVAAAMGYVWLLRERDGSDTIASRRRHGLSQKAIIAGRPEATGKVINE
jgi:hypothetical protein